MTVIGELWVTVRPDASGFNKELDSKLKSIVGGGGGIGTAISGLGAGVVAAAGAASIASIKLASDFQSTVTSIAANADIPVAAAKKIGDAFLSTSGTTIFSASQLAGAYAAVAGQLGLMAGKALTAQQALGFMKTATDLAEGSGTSLAVATSTLTGVMQAFQIPVKNAKNAADELFNTSRVAGVGIDALGSTVDRLKSRLGVATPSLKDMGALLVDLEQHGVTGSRGLLVVNTAITTLLKSADSVGPAIAKTVATAQSGVTTSTAALAKAQTALSQKQEELAGKTTLTTAESISLQNAQAAVAAATAKHTTAVGALTAAQNGLSPSLSATVQGAQALGLHVFDATGKFVGMGSVIAQLQPKLKGLNEQQQLQALSSVFGASANKALLTTVLAGSAAYDKASAAVTRSGTAHAAAEKQAGTLKHQLDLIKATITDLGIRFGNVLIPKLEDVGKVISKVTEFLTKHKAIAEALAITIGTVLAGAVAVFAVNMGTKVVGSVEKAAKSIGLFGGTAVENQASVISLNDVLLTLSGTLDALAAQLPEIDTALAATGDAFDATTIGIEAADEGLATVAETTGPAISAGLGPIGIAILAISVLLPLLLSHWKQVWGAIKDVVNDVWGAIRVALHGIEAAFDDVVKFITSHWKLIAGVLLALTGPIGIAVGLFLNFRKQIMGVVDDVVGFFVKLPGRILGAFGAVGSLLVNVGKDILTGLFKGLEFLSPLYWVIHFKNQIIGFFADVGKWLLKAGEHLVEGLIKGAVEAPINGLKHVGSAILGGIKSVFHIFSPSKDTEPIGKGLVDGIVKGIADSQKLISDEFKTIKLDKELEPQLNQLDATAKGLKVALIGIAEGLYILAEVGIGIGKNLKPAIDDITDLAKVLKLLKGDSFPKDIATGIKDLSDAGKNLHPKDIYETFLLIDEGTKLIRPAAPELKRLADALGELGKVKLSSSLVDGLKALAKVDKDLHPKEIYESFLLIGEGIEYLRPKRLIIDELATAVDKLGKVKLPKTIVDEIRNLGDSAAKLKPKDIYEAFLFIDTGIKLVTPLIPDINKLVDVLEKLGKVKISPSLRDALKDLAAVAKTLDLSGIYKEFLLIGEGAAYINGKISIIKELTQCLKDLRTAIGTGKFDVSIVETIDQKSATDATVSIDVARQSLQVQRTGFAQITTITRATQLQLDTLLQRDFALMTASIVALGGGWKAVGVELSAKLDTEESTLTQTLSVDRLAYSEAQKTNTLLAGIKTDLEKPQTVTIKGLPSSNSSNGTGSDSVAALAAAILS